MTDSAYADVVGSRFADCEYGGVHFGASGRGRLVDCTVTGTKGVAVVDNGRVDLVSLHTSLPVVQESADEPAVPATSIVNHFHGPVFDAAVEGVQLAWNNNGVVQQQQHGRQPLQPQLPQHSQQSDQDGAGS
ncbi:hypothetical protein OG562_35600 [Streptomyces sp. NBC_01275]|uniref:hypothetical protein n=1 Tax=Streptomyces sp. NBC_01275 TaxID=2903807 RepID=UPI0022522FD1|nr:hypothetical protein [Streptomyces sp. NBC_01275]MCX4766213.1 hypothetical protein [Streptomyces sp. NBC_01275]